MFSLLTATNKFKKKYYIYISLNILLGVSVFVHERDFPCDATYGQKTLELHLFEWSSWIERGDDILGTAAGGRYTLCVPFQLNAVNPLFCQDYPSVTP